MDGGSVWVVLGGLGGAAALLGWLGFVPNGQRIAAGIKARILAPRARRKALQEKVDLIFDTVQHLLATEDHLLRAEEMSMSALQKLPPDTGQEITKIKSNVETLEGLLDHTATEYQLDELIKRVEQLENAVINQLAETARQTPVLEERIADLEAALARGLEGRIFDNSPEAQRIKQAAKNRAKASTARRES